MVVMIRSEWYLDFEYHDDPELQERIRKEIGDVDWDVAALFENGYIWLESGDEIRLIRDGEWYIVEYNHDILVKLYQKIKIDKLFTKLEEY